MEEDFQIELGEKSPYYDVEFLLPSMRKWTQIVNIELTTEFNANGYSPRFMVLFRARFITYEEYQDLFKSIPEEQYHRYISFAYFDIRRTSDLDGFRFNNQNDKVSYAGLLESYATTELDGFFRKEGKTRKVLPPRAFYKHTYLVGTNGSGKSTLMLTIMYNFTYWLRKEFGKHRKTGFTVFDPAGKLANELKKMKIIADDLDNFVFIDPTLSLNHAPTINIFQIKIKHISELSVYSDKLVVALSSMFDASLTEAMQDPLGYCCNVMFWYEDMDMLDLHELLTALYKRIAQKEKANLTERQRELWNLALHLPDESTQKYFKEDYHNSEGVSVKAVLRRIGTLLRGYFTKEFITGRSKIDLAHMMRSGKIIVIKLPVGKIGDLSTETLGRLLLGHIQNIAESMSDMDEEHMPRNIVFLDEAQRFVSKYVETALSEFRKYKFSLFLAHQYAEQMDTDLLRAMLSNCRNKIVGMNSDTNAKIMAGEMMVDSEALARTPIHHFYIKEEEEANYRILNKQKQISVLFKATGELSCDTSSESKYYYSDEQAQKLIDQYMLDRYYRPVKHFGLPPEDPNVDSPIEPQDFSGREIDSLNEDDL